MFGWRVVVVVVNYGLMLDTTRKLDVCGRAGSRPVWVSEAGVFRSPGRRIIEL